MKLRVGTRRSQLALTQTGQAMKRLTTLRPDITVELVEVVTTGDRILDKPLREAGGKGLFLKELDEALLAGRIDCAVHSLKDVPTDLASGTVLAVVLEREDARDVLVTSSGIGLHDLAAGARIGTTSLRRAAQALAVKPGASIGLLRGNVETRLRKLCEGHCDATFLAAAGLRRLGLSLSPARGVALDPFEFVPAAGQGALAITARSGDRATLEAVSVLEHADSRLAVLAERAFARVFGGGCHLPLASYAEKKDGELRLVGLLIAPDGRSSIREEVRIDVPRDASEQGSAQAEAAAAAEAAGTRLAQSFFARGAAAILEQADRAGGAA